MPDPNTVPAGNTGNLIMNMLFGQQNDPAQQMSDWANTQQARNRVAIGTDLQGNLLPSPAPGTAPGVGSGQITGAPQDPTAAMAAVQQTGVLPPGQTPNATKSDQSLGSMIIALQRRDEAAAGLQQSLALAGAAISRPENRERAFKALSPGAPINAMGLGQGLMNLASQQQGQDRMNAIGQMIMDPQRGPALAGQLNMPWEALKARFQADPGGVGQMVQSYMAPTPDLQTLQGLQRMGAGGAGASPTLGDAATTLVNRIGGQPAMASAQAAWRADPKNAGKPDNAMPWKPNDLASFNQYTADQAELHDTTAKAAAVHGTAAPTLIDMQNRVADIKNNPALDTMLSSPLKKAQAQQLLSNSDPNAPISVAIKTLFPSGSLALSPQEIQLVSDIRQLNGQEYAAALGSLHQTRPAEKEIAAIRSGIGQTQMISEMTPQGYREQALNNLDENVIKPALGYSYGSSQLFKNMPADYRTYVPPEFLAGGGRALENNGSESWAASTQISPEELQTAKTWMKPVAQGGNGLTRTQVVSKLRSMGIRPEGL